MNEPNDNPMQKIWQSQPVEITKMSAEVIRKRASKFKHRIWWRNAREYVGSLIGIALFAGFLVNTHEVLLRIAYGLFIAGMLWIVIQLRRKASARDIPMGADTSTSLQLYRAELERQRDVVKNVWPWYLAPLIPGFVLYTVAYVIAFPLPHSWLRITLLDAVIAALFFAVWKMNLRAARCLQKMIDELNGAQQG
jgi:hypothetical protein